LRPGGELVGACFTDAYYEGVRTRLAAAGETIPRPEVRLGAPQVHGALSAAGFERIETWPEAVELQVDDGAAPAHLERLLGRTIGRDEAERLLSAAGRPLRLDLSPLSFRATVPAVTADA
jgi:hypothetical protein